MTEIVRRRVVVRGRVQGVWFRDTTRREAAAAGVAGWVRNRPDGAVEAVLEGSTDGVHRVIAFCRRGPPRAQVEFVDVVEEAPEDLVGFSVR
jgi:acylphosphatase